jgi:diguanylate cyclase (GGDEF)-like protein
MRTQKLTFRHATVASAVFVVAYLTELLTKAGGSWTLALVDDVGLAVAALAAAGACWWRRRHSTGVARRGWTMFAAALVAWAAGEALWSWYELVLGTEAPFPSVADVAYLLAPCLAAAAVVWLPDRPLTARGRVRMILDGLIITTSLLEISWILVLRAAYREGAEGIAAQAIALAYPVTDVVLASMALLVLARTGQHLRFSRALVVGGLLALAVADTCYAWLTNLDAYETGHVIDTLWLIGYLLLGLAALHGTRQEEESPRLERRGSIIGLAIPYVAVLVGVGAGFADALRSGGSDLFLVWCTVAVVALVLVRQLLALADNLRLTHQLEAKVDTRTAELQESEERFRYQALHDPLTGLPNRVLFFDRANTALARSRRRGGYIAVLFLDVDHFKFINDSLGHSVGDALLVTLAERLTGLLREEDTLARFSGDEFIVLCEALGDPAHAETVAERILTGLEEPFPLQGRDVVVSASIGISFHREDEVDSGAETLLRDADAAMYVAKAGGRARWAVFDDAMRHDAIARLEIEDELRRGIGEGELRVVYQPLVALPRGSVYGVEALVRWEHPIRGLMSPAEFVPVAEHSELILQLGREVLAQACADGVRWARASGAELVVSVNLAARQVADPGLVDIVRAVLDETGFEARHLCLEMTESMLMEQGPAVVGQLNALKELGVLLAVDDFGTGYSSLAYLKQFPVDHVKIDRSFVSGLGVDREDSAIVEAVVGLGHALGLGVVAEGVETPDQRARLEDLGCDVGQGYLWSHPLPPAELEHLLRLDGGQVIRAPWLRDTFELDSPTLTR